MDNILMQELNFVHLRIHSEYSLSDSLLQISMLTEKAAACGMHALAITDLGNLYATVKFYQAAMETGIKPIIGVDIRIANTDCQKNNQFHRLTLLCQNNLGYSNLLKLVSKSFLEGQTDGLPMVNPAWLPDYCDGLIALSGGMEGDIGRAILAGDHQKADIALQQWQTLFPNRFYLEVSRVGKPNEHQYIQAILKLAKKYNLPVVATNDVCFLKQQDFDAHEARVCIQEGLTLADPHRAHRYTNQQYFRNTKEMQSLFADMPGALLNTVEIAKRCNVTFALGQPRLPHFPLPEAYTSIENYLNAIAHQGLNARLQTLFANNAQDLEARRTTYEERLERELTVINTMGFAGYFLIVADFTKWAKENNIPVGPGRGSGPGSLVAYALNLRILRHLYQIV